MKAGSNYRMSKTLKASLALANFQDPHKKGQWKRAMIQAELASQVKPTRDRNKQKEND